MVQKVITVNNGYEKSVTNRHSACEVDNDHNPRHIFHIE